MRAAQNDLRSVTACNELTHAENDSSLSAIRSQVVSKAYI